MDLQTFADEKKKKVSKCRVCTLPANIRSEIDEARRNKGVGSKVVLLWLKETHGYELTRGALDYHFGEKHHDQANT